jgi:hypothetical protein
MEQMRRCPVVAALLVSGFTALVACGQEESPAFDPVTMDPPATDTLHPPAMIPFRMEVGGAGVNGLAYLAEGEGPHPTLLLLAGYPGHERNLDVAQAVRRAGINVLAFSYRGTWGNGGTMSPLNAVEDVKAALALLRSETGAARYRADPGRIALLGHSLGSWVALTVAAEDPGIECAGGLAVTNLGATARRAVSDEVFRERWARAIRSSAIPDGPVRAAEGDPVAALIQDPDAYDLLLRAPALAAKALLLVGAARDREALPDQNHLPLVAALSEAGAARLTEVMLEADHGFSSARIALAREVVGWLGAECGY